MAGCFQMGASGHRVAYKEHCPPALVPLVWFLALVSYCLEAAGTTCWAAGPLLSTAN